MVERVRITPSEFIIRDSAGTVTWTASGAYTKTTATGAYLLAELAAGPVPVFDDVSGTLFNYGFHPWKRVIPTLGQTAIGTVYAERTGQIVIWPSLVHQHGNNNWGANNFYAPAYSTPMFEVYRNGYHVLTMWQGTADEVEDGDGIYYYCTATPTGNITPGWLGQVIWAPGFVTVTGGDSISFAFSTYYADTYAQDDGSAYAGAILLGFNSGSRTLPLEIT